MKQLGKIAKLPKPMGQQVIQSAMPLPIATAKPLPIATPKPLKPPKVAKSVKPPKAPKFPQ